MPAVARPRKRRANAGATHCATERRFCRAVAISILLSRSRRWRRHSSIVSMVADARAQVAGTSPFQPSLTDPRNVQRFNTGSDDARDGGVAPLAREESCRRRAPAKPASTPPARSARRRKPRRSPASRVRCRRHRRRCPARRRPPRGHTSAPQIKARAPYADAYKPPDAPLRRPAPPLPGCLRAARHPRRHLPAEAVDRGHARLRHQSLAQSRTARLGLHGGRADAQAAIGLGAPRVRPRSARQLHRTTTRSRR